MTRQSLTGGGGADPNRRLGCESETLMSFGEETEEAGQTANALGKTQHTNAIASN